MECDCTSYRSLLLQLFDVYVFKILLCSGSGMGYSACSSHAYSLQWPRCSVMRDVKDYVVTTSELPVNTYSRCELYDVRTVDCALTTDLIKRMHQPRRSLRFSSSTAVVVPVTVHGTVYHRLSCYRRRCRLSSAI